MDFHVRKCALDLHVHIHLIVLWSARTTLAGGTFPGPLIQANKVPVSTCILHMFLKVRVQGDHFAINVVNKLDDSSMYKSTSVVSGTTQLDFSVVQYHYSIGMGSSRTEPTMQMAFHSSHSAPLHRMAPSFIPSTYRIRLALTGTIAIIPRNNGLSTFTL
jgi:hypothetical protein